MLDTIQRIYEHLGRPPMRPRSVAAEFTATVAAILHFGYAPLGIVADPAWGRRRNSTGPLGADTLKRRDTGEVWDFIRSAGNADWGFVWNRSDPGVAWEAPNRDDLPAGAPDPPRPPDPPPPPPPGVDVVGELRAIRSILERVFGV